MSDESIVDLVKKHQAQATSDSMPEQNAGSVQQKAASLAEAMPEDRATTDALNTLLANVRNKMAWIEVNLPSKGLLYPNQQSVVKIRPFTFDDERILKSTAAAQRPEQTIEKLLRNCVNGIDVSVLTPHDRLYLLFRVRGLSYGDDYPIQHDCTSCGNTSKLTLQISTLQTTPLDEAHMRFMLPDSEQEAVIKLPRLQDEHLYDTPEKLMQNMYQFVHSIGGITDQTILEAFIEKTTVRDVDTLRRRIFTPEYGMEDHFFYTCNACGTKNRVAIGLNEDFFTAS